LSIDSKMSEYHKVCYFWRYGRYNTCNYHRLQACSVSDDRIGFWLFIELIAISAETISEVLFIKYCQWSICLRLRSRILRWYISSMDGWGCTISYHYLTENRKELKWILFFLIYFNKIIFIYIILFSNHWDCSNNCCISKQWYWFIEYC